MFIGNYSQMPASLKKFAIGIMAIDIALLLAVGIYIGVSDDL